MAPSNFKTYEAQSRLLAAVIASSPNLKLDFKAIVRYYGSDVTASGLEHRFRPIKKQVAIIRAAVDQGVDVKDIQNVVCMSEKEICKHYGESTPQGLEFQFRSIKKDAKALRDAVGKGENPLTALGKSAPSTPGKRKAAATPKTGGSTAKRQRKKAPASSEDDDKEVDYESLDVKTPTKPKPKAAQPQSQAKNGSNVTSSTTPDLTYENTPDNEYGNSRDDPLRLDDELVALKQEEYVPAYVKLENDPLLSQVIDGHWDDMTDGVA
ncbi:hypothetical protein MAPG_07381 [Magnaporthiopsis poae ATCC 64411]|uniref:Uncharacterized protein n=1 Tax=Magnaporthiopsis poae (strain ATCC 64411 / 73-15) TaxID=644358 RepID=A0A0C4E4I7_MAGP6|nr:hypothetical protein MAPG_07381 [Magnaporthiopsis poae ATCC 64411]